MKKLLALALVVMVAGSAIAEDNEFGMFFSPDVFGQEQTNINTPIFTPFFGYVVMLYPSVVSVGGYEVGIIVPPTVLALSASGPNGWTNFGDNFNHLVGYGAPVPAAPEGTVLCTLQLMLNADAVVGIEYHASNPGSVPGHDGPAITDGEDPTIILPCPLTVDANGEFPFTVATINGPGVVATEDHTLSSVKALFR